MPTAAAPATARALGPDGQPCLTPRSSATIAHESMHLASPARGMSIRTVVAVRVDGPSRASDGIIGAAVGRGPRLFLPAAGLDFRRRQCLVEMKPRTGRGRVVGATEGAGRGFSRSRRRGASSATSLGSGVILRLGPPRCGPPQRRGQPRRTPSWSRPRRAGSAAPSTSLRAPRGLQSPDCLTADETGHVELALTGGSRLSKVSS